MHSARECKYKQAAVDCIRVLVALLPVHLPLGASPHTMRSTILFERSCTRCKLYVLHIHKSLMKPAGFDFYAGETVVRHILSLYRVFNVWLPPPLRKHHCVECIFWLDCCRVVCQSSEPVEIHD